MLETATADDGTYRIFPLPGGAYDISFIRGDEVLYERPEPLSIPEGDFVTFGITFEPADEPQ